MLNLLKVCDSLIIEINTSEIEIVILKKLFKRGITYTVLIEIYDDKNCA